MIRFLSWLLSPTCRCGHNRNAHQHYRAGTDCSGCDCPAFRWHLFADLRDRGEVAGVPEVEDIPQAQALDEACALTRPIPKRPPDYPTTPAERRFADDIEAFLKELTR